MEFLNRPCMDIKLIENNPTIFDSKVGGMGYIPHDKDFPTDKNGNQLRLLAQIDCAEVQLPEFSGKGLLQFWISTDDLYGCDFSNPTVQDGFRVIYYPETDKTVTEDEIKSKFVLSPDEKTGEALFPVNKECGMIFEKSENRYITPEIIENSYPEDTDEDIIYNDERWGENFGHKVGGYPDFTQEDPRNDEMLEKYDYLLFQLASEFKFNVLWGDLGIGNFFINSEKLKNLDFSDVLYNWDCG